MMAFIESVDEVWQRNHMMMGEGRQASPMSEARAIRGHHGTLAGLKAMAQSLADKCLATVWIRTQNNLHVVTPNRDCIVMYMPWQCWRPRPKLPPGGPAIPPHTQKESMMTKYDWERERRLARRDELERRGGIFSEEGKCGLDELPCGVCDECVAEGVLS